MLGDHGIYLGMIGPIALGRCNHGVRTRISSIIKPKPRKRRPVGLPFKGPPKERSRYHYDLDHLDLYHPEILNPPSGLPFRNLS